MTFVRSLTAVAIGSVVLVTTACSMQPAPVDTPLKSKAPSVSATQAPNLDDFLSDLEVMTRKPNSANGVDVEYRASNISKREIKYIYFTVEPVNAVDDVVVSEIGSKSRARLKVTGPIGLVGGEANDSGVWKNVWYNPSIVRLNVISIEIEFMDSTNVVVEGKSLGVNKSGIIEDKASPKSSAPSEADIGSREGEYIHILRNVLNSDHPELDAVSDNNLLEAGHKMCDHPSYSPDSVWGEWAYIDLPEGLSEDQRVVISAAAGLRLCP